MNFPQSVLAELVTGEADKRESGREFIRIDRDGKHFGRILNYMRDPGSLDLNRLTESTTREIKTEAEFYHLHHLVEICEHKLHEIELAAELTIDLPPAASKLELIFCPLQLKKLVEKSRRPAFILKHSLLQRLDNGDLETLVKSINYKRFNLFAYGYDDFGEELELGDEEVKICLIENGCCRRKFRVALDLEKSCMMTDMWRFLVECS